MGEVRVGEVVVAVGLAGVNCDVSSASWLRRRGSCEVMELETATVSSMAMFFVGITGSLTRLMCLGLATPTIQCRSAVAPVTVRSGHLGCWRGD